MLCNINILHLIRLDADLPALNFLQGDSILYLILCAIMLDTKPAHHTVLTCPAFRLANNLMFELRGAFHIQPMLSVGRAMTHPLALGTMNLS